MRNNLLSLQQTAKLQDLTQNRLATGLKVNSAIDNPSSYYTAQSLNNRAEDLNVLLDAMSQGIQTLKAVNESIEAGTKFLEQAKSVASSALETSAALYQGPIAATVSTESELLDAIANTTAADGVIVIASDITLTTNTKLVLKDGQKLVGQNFIDGKGGTAKLTFNFNNADSAVGIDLSQGSQLSDLIIDYTTLQRNNHTDFHALRNNGFKDIKLHNLDIIVKAEGTEYFSTGGIGNFDGGEITLSGEINITAPSATSRYVYGVYTRNAGKIVQLENSVFNITTMGERGYGIAAGNNTFNGVVNISTSGKFGVGILDCNNILNGTLNITTSAQDGYGIWSGTNYLTNAAAKLNLHTLSGFNFFHQNSPKFQSVPGAEIMTELGVYKCTNPVTTDTTFENVADKLIKIGNFDATRMNIDLDDTQEENSLMKQFNQILTQYDMLINDSWYKGINLLKSQDLKVVFNESRTSDLDIKGVDATTAGLGLETADWNSAAGVQNSLDQIDSAINQLRLYTSEFGNYYQIVTTRENFTNSLINVLTEGADQLTLADMNQESANMLALQTRQQLAVNSLSLASQASQSVLKLF